ncbi:aspartyl/asparaginyl beta-hydroxylase domain-containing protein [Brevundimonas sp. FT23028]|uniref:aspartyl/asparaginyl beta-hydroxylase domain-containing protein n=1 Tax=Brevundimonas sp. FT23028 TaxID=3393748 RepID=UPI003B587070
MKFGSVDSGALAAFSRGDWRGAGEQLDAAIRGGGGDAETFALLADCRRRLDESSAAHEAAERALAIDPRNLRATLVKADLLVGEGKRREANFYHGVALEIAAEGGVTPDLRDGVHRAQAARAAVQADLQALVQEELREAGYREGRSSPRFTLALDVLMGRKQPYFQQPTAFYYPGLPNLEFYPREQFPWLDAVEAEVEAMTTELEGVLRDEATFAPYLRPAAGIPGLADYPLINSMDWSTCSLWKSGAETAMAARCPRTMAALAEAPLCRVKARSPEVMFSQLRAGAHIRPHTGVANTRLICHVPLIVPSDCVFRVGNDVREWEKGRGWVFDDTIEHEARNGSDRTRVILMFDIWRPELGEEERLLVSALLEAMDAYSPHPGAHG